MQDIPFFSHKVHCGGEFITFPAKSTSWQVVANAVAVGAPPGAPIFTVLGGSKLTADITNTDTAINVKGVALPQQKGIYLAVGNLGGVGGFAPEFMQVTGQILNKNNTGFIFTVTRGATIGGVTVAARSFASGTTVSFVTPTATDAAQVGTTGVASSVIIPMIEHTLEWDFVQKPPWSAIRSTMGKVNATKFAGMPPETALFLGAEASQQVTITGLKPWKLSYKISEKNQNAADPKNPQGWNHFMRPTGDNAGQFGRLIKTVPFVFGKGAFLGVNGNPGVQLVADMNATQQFLKVSDTGLPFPQQGQFTIDISGEIIIVTGIVTAGAPGTWGCIRGCSGTTAAPHSALFGIVPRPIFQVGGGIYDSANFSYLFPKQ
jgi:hypothetical protein